MCFNNVVSFRCNLIALLDFLKLFLGFLKILARNSNVSKSTLCSANFYTFIIQKSYCP